MAVLKTRRIKVMDATYISPLQMYGPIVSPMNISEGIAYDLVRKLYTVIEVSPTNKELKLTVMNFYNPDRFGEPVAETIKKIEAPKAEKPVVMATKPEVKKEAPTPVIVPDNIALREVKKDTIIVPPTEVIPTTEPIINMQESESPAIPLPVVDKEAPTTDEASNDDVDDSAINDEEDIDEDDEPDEDSEESSSNGSVTSSAASASPSNKKKHNRGKKHR